MKYYLLKNAEGKYLNSDYHSSRRHGMWRDRDNARLYRSIRGIRSAFSTVTPALMKLVGIYWTRPTGMWTEEDRRLHSAQFNAINSLSTDVYFRTLAEDGYVLEQIEI